MTPTAPAPATTPPPARAPAPDEAAALLRSLTRALGAVALLAGVFTAVNTTLFATAHGVPRPIAVLLDPMVALALATVLLADGRLATWGLPPPRWSTALRWFTGLAATAMNTWTSLWPGNRGGRPHHADPAGVLLHTVPPLLLILLTETVAAYRKLLTGYGPGYGTGQPTPAPEPAPNPHPAPTTPQPAGATAPPPHPEPAPDAPAGPNPIPAALFRHALTLHLASASRWRWATSARPCG
jgi:hypothetical protein